MANASTSTATTNYDKLIQTLISKRLEELLRNPLPHLLPGNFIKATHVAGSNGTMRFLNVPDILVNDAEVAASVVVTEGVPNDTDDLAFGYEEFTTRQRMKTLRFTDVALLKSPLELLAVGAERLARYVAAVSDRIAASKISTGANKIRVGGGAALVNIAAGNVVTGTILKQAVAGLEADGVPRFGDGFYRCEVHPFVKFDIEVDTASGGWVDASRYAGSMQLFSGELGTYAGIRFVSSANAFVFTGAGAGGIDVYSTTIHGPDFFAMGDFGNNQTFVTPPGGHDDPGHQSALITWKGWADAMVVGEGTNATAVSGPRYVRIESASAA